jgi:hypothetical protein
VSLIRAMLLSIAGAVGGFCSVLIVLDESPLAWLIGERNRVAAFAAPGLGTATPGSLTALRPVPVPNTTSEGQATRRSREPVPAATAEATAEVVFKGAQVPPIARRQPEEPSASPAVESPAVARGEPARANAVARRQVPALDATTRSALGGPRAPVKAPSAGAKKEPGAAKSVPRAP